MIGAAQIIVHAIEMQQWQLRMVQRGDNSIQVITIIKIDAIEKQANVHYAYQEQQLGTGHAVMCAMPTLPDNTRHVVVLCGDVPLLSEATLQRFVDDHRNNDRTLTVLAMRLEDPTGYGRIIQNNNGEK